MKIPRAGSEAAEPVAEVMQSVGDEVAHAFHVFPSAVHRQQATAHQRPALVLRCKGPVCVREPCLSILSGGAHA